MYRTSPTILVRSMSPSKKSTGAPRGLMQKLLTPVLLSSWVGKLKVNPASSILSTPKAITLLSQSSTLTFRLVRPNMVSLFWIALFSPTRYPKLQCAAACYRSTRQCAQTPPSGHRWSVCSIGTTALMASSITANWKRATLI